MRPRFSIIFLVINRYFLLLLAALVLLTSCRDAASGVSSSIKGKEYFDYYGCKTCHSLTGEAMYGPPLHDLFNSTIMVMRDGETKPIVVDRRYLLRSILDPEYEKVTDYQNRTMPITDMPSDRAKAIVDYLVSLEEQQKKN